MDGGLGLEFEEPGQVRPGVRVSFFGGGDQGEAFEGAGVVGAGVEGGVKAGGGLLVVVEAVLGAAQVDEEVGVLRGVGEGFAEAGGGEGEAALAHEAGGGVAELSALVGGGVRGFGGGGLGSEGSEAWCFDGGDVGRGEGADEERRLVGVGFRCSDVGFFGGEVGGVWFADWECDVFNDAIGGVTSAVGGDEAEVDDGWCIGGGEPDGALVGVGDRAAVVPGIGVVVEETEALVAEVFFDEGAGQDDGFVVVDGFEGDGVDLDEWWGRVDDDGGCGTGPWDGGIARGTGGVAKDEVEVVPAVVGDRDFEGVFVGAVELGGLPGAAGVGGGPQVDVGDGGVVGGLVGEDDFAVVDEGGARGFGGAGGTGEGQRAE